MIVKNKFIEMWPPYQYNLQYKLFFFIFKNVLCIYMYTFKGIRILNKHFSQLWFTRQVVYVGNYTASISQDWKLSKINLSLECNKRCPCVGVNTTTNMPPCVKLRIGQTHLVQMFTKLRVNVPQHEGQ